MYICIAILKLPHCADTQTTIERMAWFSNNYGHALPDIHCLAHDVSPGAKSYREEQTNQKYKN
jgi:hypothetical protein